MRRLAGLLLFAVLALVAAGCGGATTSQPVATANPPPAAGTAPAQVVIDKIAASSTLIALRKQSNGEIETPDVKTPQQAGWYSLGVVPGLPGPAVILGHVDGDGKPGIFKRLSEMKAGDLAEVTREDGKVLRFRAYSAERVPKDAFPTAKVYRNTAGPELRLITCGGAFVGGDLGYADNVIVYLKLDEAGA